MTARIFQVASVGCALAGLYHAVGLADPALVEAAPRWRHALFIGVNAALAVLFLRRPRWFLWVFGALVAQQVHGHADRGLRIWRDERRVDWPSVVVLLALPPLLALLWRERRRGAP